MVLGRGWLAIKSLYLCADDAMLLLRGVDAIGPQIGVPLQAPRNTCMPRFPFGPFG